MKSRKTLKNKADKIFAEKIRSKDYCQLKGLDHIACNGNLQCMHIISRSNYNLRWDQINAICGCAAHHIFYTHEPWAWQELIKYNFPERYEYLNEHRNEIWDKDYDKILSELSDWKI